MFKWLKRVLPHSLFGRALMILFLPTVTVQVVATYMFYERHWEDVAKHMANSLAGDVVYVTAQLKQANKERRREITKQAKELLRMNIAFEPSRKQEKSSTIIELARFAHVLEQELDVPFSVTRSVDREGITVSIYSPEETLRISVSKKRLVSSTTYIFIMWMVGTAVLVLIIAIVFLRNQVRPISLLAQAAEAFGKGREFKNFRPRGATEVRRAGAAFLNMKERITRQISTRTEMLAAISHDLRTPLTRLKLELAMLPEKDVAAMQKDLLEMEHMIEEYLRFAKGEGPEASNVVNLNMILTDIVSNYRRQGQEIGFEPAGEMELSLRENAMRRCLHNLLDNALRYAKAVTLSTQENARSVDIIIDDNGPGIPEKDRQRVLQPFTRLDPSRNLNKSGVGLGMTIAQDIVLSHGGKLRLEDSPLSGLRVRLTLPF